MAWIALVIVTLIFFIPGIGLGPLLAAQDIALSVPLPFFKFAISIPFTGPVRLFAVCLATWLLLWLVPIWLERWLKTDFLTKIGLHNDLVHAYRPPHSIKVAVFLAKITFWVALVKAVLILVLRAVVELLLPLLAVLLGPALAPWVSGGLNQVLGGLLGLRADWSVVLVVFCVLVLIANWGFKWEQSQRYIRDIRQIQFERRKNQKEIVIPSTQI